MNSPKDLPTGSRALAGGGPPENVSARPAPSPGAAKSRAAPRRTGAFLLPDDHTPDMAFESLADGWVVWSDEGRKAVLAFRPDVFDTVAYPAPCMPTIYVSKGQRGRRPGRDDPPADADWYVTLYLEPDVSLAPKRAETRGEAEELAEELAANFAAGEVAVRDLYQVPREAYLERLEALTGTE